MTEARLTRGLPLSNDLKLQLTQLMQRLVQLVPENRLLQANLDPKLLLMQLPAPKETLPDSSIKLLIGLLKHLDGAVARIQTQQLASLPQEDAARQVWQFELPVRNGEEIDLLHIRIGRDDSANAKENEPAVWTLTLHMDLAKLGPMRIHLRLQGEQLSTLIWSERSETNTLIQSHLQELRSAYEQRGLSVDRLEAHQGRANRRDELPLDGALLHEKA
jgi:flagellar hook-length control protein FliK